MAVDFNKAGCVETTTANIFGICDDPPPDEQPAYLDDNDSDKWIAWVDNTNNREISFTAIDHCLEIMRSNGEQESSCDGMLQYDSTIIFVELKDRNSGRWLGKARDQLETTIKIYKNDVGLDGYDRYYAYIANKQRPYFYAANSSIAEEFDSETGFVLIVEHTITID